MKQNQGRRGRRRRAKRRSEVRGAEPAAQMTCAEQAAISLVELDLSDLPEVTPPAGYPRLVERLLAGVYRCVHLRLSALPPTALVEARAYARLSGRMLCLEFSPEHRVYLNPKTGERLSAPPPASDMRLFEQLSKFSMVELPAEAPQEHWGGSPHGAALLSD